MKSKDIRLLQHILRYCDNITDIINQFGNSLDIFLKVNNFHDLISFNLLQIGELVNHLSNEFLTQTSQIIPWRDIVDLRNRFVHGYLLIDFTKVWNTVQNDFPALEAFCKETLRNNQTVPDENSKPENPKPAPPRFRP
jgi:uncharacterized protein with HEPN domain